MSKKTQKEIIEELGDLVEQLNNSLKDIQHLSRCQLERDKSRVRSLTFLGGELSRVDNERELFYKKLVQIQQITSRLQEIEKV